MTKSQQKAAWNNSPLPNDLTLTEQLQYIMLRCVYRQFKKKTISEDEAKKMKEYVVKYGALTTKAKGSLMQWVYSFLCEEYAGGYEIAGIDKARIEHYYSLLFRQAPHNPVIDK